MEIHRPILTFVEKLATIGPPARYQSCNGRTDITSRRIGNTINHVVSIALTLTSGAVDAVFSGGARRTGASIQVAFEVAVVKVQQVG